MKNNNDVNQPEEENKPDADLIKDLKIYCSLVNKNVKEQFCFIAPCGKGNYGKIAKIKINPQNSKIEYNRAIKFSLPKGNLDSQKLDEARASFLSEIGVLYQLRHPNIPQIYAFDEINTGEKIIPYYIMEFLDGQSLDIFLNDQKNQKYINENLFFNLIEQTLSALIFSHQHEILHLDIKPDNIFVVADNDELRFVLCDFGKSKNIELLAKSGTEYVNIGGGIYEYVHPKLHEFLRKDRAKAELFIEEGRTFDLYSLGQVFQFVLDKIPSLNKIDSHWSFFINDLCWCESGKKKYSRLINYTDGEAAIEKARKLINFKINKGLPQLYDNDKGSTIRLTEDETMPFPNLIKRFVDTPEFQKLRNINQLAGTDLVYPGATHTRFVHSLGVCSKCILYIKSLLNNSLFYYLYDDSDIENLILCALLHDLGHYPFSHYLEEIKGMDNLSVKHEELTLKILSNNLSINKAITSESGKIHAANYLPKIKISIAEKLCETSIGEMLSNEGKLDTILKIINGENKYILFKNIITSSIDCDKLDYLSRDSKYAGVTYGKLIDVERFIKSLTIDYSKAVSEKEKNEFPALSLAITSKGVSAVESIIHSRYSLFSEVYWHKKCRTATAMIKDAFWYASDTITQEEFEWASLMLNDDEFLLFITSKLSASGKFDIAADLLGGIRNGYIRRIYKSLITFSKAWDESRYQNLLSELTNNFKLIHEKKNELILKMNEAEKGAEWKALKNHHLIIDVPNIKIDSNFTLQVKYSDEIEGKKYYDFKDISMSKADINYSKKVRIFCHPEYYLQIKALGCRLDQYINETLLD